MTWLDEAIADIKSDEACRLFAYLDGTGVWTIGYGHTRGVKAGDSCTLAQAQSWLAEDVNVAERSLDAGIQWWFVAPNPVRRGLLNMAFNMGWPRLSGFEKMLAAGANANWGRMADEALNSKWATQVGSRSARIADLFRSADQLELAV